MEARFRYVEPSGAEVQVSTLAELRKHVRWGRVTEGTLLFDSLTGEWAPAKSHLAFELVRDPAVEEVGEELEGAAPVTSADDAEETGDVEGSEAVPDDSGDAASGAGDPEPDSGTDAESVAEIGPNLDFPDFGVSLADTSGTISTEEVLEKLRKEREEDRAREGSPTVRHTRYSTLRSWAEDDEIEEDDEASGRSAHSVPDDPFRSRAGDSTFSPASRRRRGTTRPTGRGRSGREGTRRSRSGARLARMASALQTGVTLLLSLLAWTARSSRDVFRVGAAMARRGAGRGRAALTEVVGSVREHRVGELVTPAALRRYLLGVLRALASGGRSGLRLLHRSAEAIRTRLGGPGLASHLRRFGRHVAVVAVAGALGVLVLGGLYHLMTREQAGDGGIPGSAQANPAPVASVATDKVSLSDLASTEGVAFQDMIEAMDSLRGIHGVERVPGTWLDGRYLAEASAYPEVREYWERYQQFIDAVRGRDTALFRQSFVGRLREEGVSGPMISIRLVRAVQAFEESQPQRDTMYAHMEDLANTALELHHILVDREADIEHDPVRGDRASRDPFLEAWSEDRALQETLWKLVDRITRDIATLHGASPDVRADLTARLLDDIRASPTRDEPALPEDRGSPPSGSQ